MNFNSLTTEMSTILSQITSGELDLRKAQAANSTIKNIHAHIRLGLLNAKMRNEKPNMEFFDGSNRGPKEGGEPEGGVTNG